MLRPFPALWFATLLLLLCAGRAVRAKTYDVLIRGGRVVDGSGLHWLAADIGINGERIVTVGKLPETTGKQAIDATGHFSCRPTSTYP